MTMVMAITMTMIVTMIIYIGDDHNNDERFYALTQDFIKPSPHQAQPLLQMILDAPQLSGILSPNFCPNRCPSQFVEMYRQVMIASKLDSQDLGFMLLSKVKWISCYKKHSYDERCSYGRSLTVGFYVCCYYVKSTNGHVMLTTMDKHSVYLLFLNNGKLVIFRENNRVRMGTGVEILLSH